MQWIIIDFPPPCHIGASMVQNPPIKHISQIVGYIDNWPFLNQAIGSLHVIFLIFFLFFIQYILCGLFLIIQTYVMRY